MAKNKEPYTFRWSEQSPGKRINVVDSNNNIVATFTLANLIQFSGMWGSSNRGSEWIPLWVDKATGALHVEDLPVTATIVYNRNADNFITSEVWTLSDITVTVTYTRNTDNFITKREVAVS